jgi:hypothetical protein
LVEIGRRLVAEFSKAYRTLFGEPERKISLGALCRDERITLFPIS